MSDEFIAVPRIPNIAGMMAENMRRDAEHQAKIAGRYDARFIFQHLMQRAEHFQNSLKEDEEIGLQLANYGLAAQLHIRAIGYQNPNLLEFSGLTIDGNECILVQHISQLNFILIALKPVEDKPYRIGFGR